MQILALSFISSPISIAPTLGNSLHLIYRAPPCICSILTVYIIL